MTDKEKREDEALKKCIQDAYGCSDEQLMKELEEIEESLSDSDFPGLEDLLMSKLMARIDEADTEEATAEPEDTPDVDIAEEVTEEKKVVRVGKKKVLLVAALAAAFVGVLGVTAIGGKSYFFKEDTSEIREFNNTQNKSEASKAEDAYKQIQSELGIKVIKMNYLPENMIFDGVIIEDDKSIICYKYNDNNFYFIQREETVDTTIGIGSDRESSGIIENEWIGKRVEYSQNELDSGEMEFEAEFSIENAVYCLWGKMAQQEFEKILRNLYFY